MFDVILRTVLCYVVVMKPMYFVMKIIVTKRLNKEKKSYFLLDFRLKNDPHQHPSERTVGSMYESLQPLT